jgi:GGDEF domain-containing protein
MQPEPPRRRRARPVADAPVDALLARAEDLAKGWMVALLEQAPLEDAPSILAADLVRDGPRLCEAVVRALSDEEDLRRLDPGGPLEMLASQTGELAGAGGPAGVARAVDALHDVIWAAVRQETPYADSDQVSELSERLALVTSIVRSAALGRAAEPRGNPHEVPVAPPPRPPPMPVRPAMPRDHDALWIGALGDEIERAQRAGAPLALLLVELDDAERVIAVEREHEATATFGRFAAAVRSVVRRQDILASETGARAWIIARDTGRAGAQALASRIALAVGETPAWRGAPLTVSAGVAVLGEDGWDSSGLIEAAEEAALAAAASGIIRAVPDREPHDDPPGMAG